MVRTGGGGLAEWLGCQTKNLELPSSSPSARFTLGSSRFNILAAIALTQVVSRPVGITKMFCLFHRP